MRGFRNVGLDPRNKEIIKRAIQKDAQAFMLASFMGSVLGSSITAVFFIGLGAFLF